MATDIKYGIRNGRIERRRVRETGKPVSEAMRKFITEMAAKGYSRNEIVFVYSPAMPESTLRSIRSSDWENKNEK